jgi:hypothetical protein
MRSRALALAVVVLLAPAMGCMGDGEPAIESANLGRLVLQPDDLGAGFVLFDEGRLGRADYQPGPRRDPQRFGRLDGWKARYRIADPREREGILVVQSIVDAFDSAQGADQDLAAYEQEFEREQPSGSGLSFEPVGEETAAVLFEANGVFFCSVAWRYENVTGSVLTQSFERETVLAQAFELARKQQGRIAAAAAE